VTNPTNPTGILRNTYPVAFGAFQRARVSSANIVNVTMYPERFMSSCIALGVIFLYFFWE
jgi:hypothetical protein